MPRTVGASRAWMQAGTTLLLDAVATLHDAEYDAPSGLPGWTRRHLVAHVAANADALGNLVHWAATGEETPMYASPAERAAGIERGAALPALELRAWLTDSAATLEAALGGLDETQWAHEVRTAQGRTVPATEIPWMRAREVCVHAVDLDLPAERGGVGFADLPVEFNLALCDEIGAKRGLDALPPEVAHAPLPEATAWLAGRPHTIDAAPGLGPWL